MNRVHEQCPNGDSETLPSQKTWSKTKPGARAPNWPSLRAHAARPARSRPAPHAPTPVPSACLHAPRAPARKPAACPARAAAACLLAHAYPPAPARPYRLRAPGLCLRSPALRPRAPAPRLCLLRAQCAPAPAACAPPGRIVAWLGTVSQYSPALPLLHSRNTIYCIAIQSPYSQASCNIILQYN